MALYSGAKSFDGSAVAMYLEQYSVGGEFSVAPDGKKWYFISDHQGNVRCKFTKDEAQFFDYTPFGKTLDESYNDANGWISSERDFESKYMNLQARLYDPVIGRFLSVDPLAEIQLGITPYHYCGNDPVNAKDPSGLFQDEVLLKQKSERESSLRNSISASIYKTNSEFWYGFKANFLNGMMLDHERHEGLAKYAREHATTKIRVLIPTGIGPAYEATEKFLTVQGIIENASTFVMSQEMFDSYTNQINEGVKIEYNDLQGSFGKCFEATTYLPVIIGNFDLNPYAYARGYETAFVSEGMNVEFGISNKDINAPNCSISMNILFSMNCEILYAGHSHCDGDPSSSYNRDQNFPTPGYATGMGYNYADYSIFGGAKTGLILRPTTVTFYNESGYLTIHKSYIMR